MEGGYYKLYAAILIEMHTRQKKEPTPESSIFLLFCGLRARKGLPEDVPFRGRLEET
jgi:hypothetical protein